MELKVKEYSVPQTIEWNYDELKNELVKRTEVYKNLVYTDETIKEAKQDKATLNKLKKALNDERLKREREYMKPFDEFKEKVKEIIGIIDEPILAIDTQVKAYEEKQKEQKRAQIEEYFDSIAVPEWLRLEQIFNQKWLNSSVTMKSVKEEIDGKLEGIERDLATLGNLSEFGFEAKEEYKRTLDINGAIAEGQRLADIQKRKREEEQKKPEPVKVPESEKVETPKEVSRQWVNFSVLLSRDEAFALRRFFDENGIEFKRI